jgi:hypothetical protein
VQAASVGAAADQRPPAQGGPAAAAAAALPTRAGGPTALGSSLPPAILREQQSACQLGSLPPDIMQRVLLCGGSHEAACLSLASRRLRNAVRAAGQGWRPLVEARMRRSVELAHLLPALTSSGLSPDGNG